MALALLAQALDHAGLGLAAHGDIVSEGANPAAVLDKAHRASPIQDGGARTGAAGEPLARGGHAAAALRRRSDPRRDRFARAERSADPGAPGRLPRRSP